jgi:lipopolysaccharide transport system permease protein
MRTTSGDNASVLKTSSAIKINAQAASTESAMSDDMIAPHIDKPLIVIEASKSWRALNLLDIWQYRELLYFMVWRDVKVRYKQTVLGASWAVLQPLLTMIIFTIFFGRLAGIPSDNMPYPVFAYAALLPWTFFSNAVTASSNSLIGSSNLITKVYFPRMIIPSAAVGAGLVDFAIAFLVFLGLMVFYSITPSVNMLMLPALLLLTTMLALGVGMWMSAMNVKYRDIRYALPFLMQIWMFASPIVYSTGLVPQKWQWLLALNPLTGIIDGFRAALLGRPFNWSTLSSSLIITLIVLVYSAYSFRRVEKQFADII